MTEGVAVATVFRQASSSMYTFRETQHSSGNISLIHREQKPKENSSSWLEATDEKWQDDKSRRVILRGNRLTRYLVREGRKLL